MPNSILPPETRTSCVSKWRSIYVSNMKEVLVRELTILDMIKLNRMYDSLSEKSKFYFHPGILGVRSIGLRWFLAQIALVFSTQKILRKLLSRIIPKSCFLSVVAINTRNEVVGFAYVEFITRSIGGLGIVVKDNYQNKEVGFFLMKYLLNMAIKEGISEIRLTTLSVNVKALRFYEKFGFKIVRETIDKYRDKSLKATVMRLCLHEIK
jgi:ribosomal protein S18 acetylase RimI-like enzyme